MRSVFEVMANSIVNPHCDECGCSVRPLDPLLGPHLCFACQTRVNAEFEARFHDYLSQERPDRKVHIVKLPTDFDRNLK